MRSVLPDPPRATGVCAACLHRGASPLAVDLVVPDALRVNRSGSAGRGSVWRCSRSRRRSSGARWSSRPDPVLRVFFGSWRSGEKRRSPALTRSTSRSSSPRAWSWTGSWGRRGRIFQGLSIPEIVKQVLDEGSVASRASLSRTYPRREYRVQHQESDLDFVSRLLEEEGISYWFDHERGGHTLVLGDNPSANPEIEGGAWIAFRERTRAAAEAEHVDSFRVGREVRPTVVALHDRDWQRPALDLS